MTALSIGLGIGPCIPVILGDIPIVPDGPPDPPPAPPPPELRLPGDGTIEITVSEGTVTVTLGDTGLYDGTYAFHTSDLAGGPVAIVPPVLTGLAEVGGVLTARPALLVHPAGRAPAVDRRWLRDGVAIEGAEGATYTVVAADRGRSLAVLETATNADGARSSASAALAVPAPAPPPPPAPPANLLAFNDPAAPGYSRGANVTINAQGELVVARTGGGVSFHVRHIGGALDGIANISVTARMTGAGRLRFFYRLPRPEGGGDLNTLLNDGNSGDPFRTVDFAATIAVPSGLVATSKATLYFFNDGPADPVIVNSVVTKATT